VQANFVGYGQEGKIGGKSHRRPFANLQEHCGQSRKINLHHLSKGKEGRISPESLHLRPYSTLKKKREGKTKRGTTVNSASLSLELTLLYELKAWVTRIPILSNLSAKKRGKSWAGFVPLRGTIKIKIRGLREVRNQLWV